jgi:crossover junction endodeoxyribonuclease RuvC
VPGVLGIDPGTTGACALYSSHCSPESGLRWVIIDLPVLGSGKKELHAGELMRWLQHFSPEHAVLELVHATPHWGNASTFQFGRMFGAIQATLACSGISHTLVTPREWKKFFNLKGPDKEASRVRAAHLFPDQSKVLARKLDQNRAEAMLIAYYGEKVLMNGHK